MQRLKEEEREAQECMLEEEAKAQKAKEEEAAALEFEKWKGEFSVDDEGTLEEVEDNTEDLISNFVEYIKKHKCVPLEDLAAEFKLRTQRDLEAMANLKQLFSLAEKFGYSKWLQFDASVVRGLAYYTGIVFELPKEKGLLSDLSLQIHNIVCALDEDLQGCVAMVANVLSEIVVYLSNKMGKRGRYRPHQGRKVLLTLHKLTYLWRRSEGQTKKEGFMD